MRQHLISQEGHLISVCYTCGAGIVNQSWKSEFHGEFHYKTTTCWKCGKDHSIKVNFHGSGDDDWEEKVKDFIKFNLDHKEIKKNMSKEEEIRQKNNQKIKESLYARIAREIGKNHDG